MRHFIFFLALANMTFTSLLFGQGITREIYTDLYDKDLNSIRLSPKFKLSPDVYDVQPIYESTQSYGNDYGAHLRGYITAPVSGHYVFYLASDDTGELYISKDGLEVNKELIASVGGWTSYRDFDKYETQKSESIALTEGQVIYTEALFKERGGGDHLTVAWSIDGGEIEVVSGEYLTPYFSNLTSIQNSLSDSIIAAETLYSDSSLNIGTDPGQYTEAMRVLFQIQIDEAKILLETESVDLNKLGYAVAKLDKAYTEFNGGLKASVLRGEAFGSYPWRSESYAPEKVFDTNPSTAFRYLFPDDGYVGLDLGEGNETAITKIRFLPEYKRGGGVGQNKFQGSFDGLTYTDLYIIPEDTTVEWHEINITDAAAYRYYRYYDDSNGSDYTRIAEIEFMGISDQELRMQKHEVINFAANSADQLIKSSSILADHGGLPAKYLSYKLLELPLNGILKLNDIELDLDQTFTQEDINNELLTFSTDGSRNGTIFSVELTSSIGGTLPEVAIEIQIDSDGDGLTDSQEISLGLDPDLADTDGDGMDDGWEVENGLDALKNTVIPLVTSINGENGLTATYMYGSFTSVNNFASMSPAKVEKVSSLNFPVYNRSEFANSGVKDYVAAKFKGYLYVPVGGNYKFLLSSDDGSRLFIDDIQVITNDGLHGIKRVENTVNLSAGFHRIRCDFFEGKGNHGLILEWEGPGRTREIIPSANYFLSLDEHEAEIEAIDQDQDGLTDILEEQEGTDPLNPDSDGDRLLDGEEYHAVYRNFKTNPLSVDTDNDTVSDYDEIFVFLSNPLVPDFDGSQFQMDLIPINTSNRIGDWQEDGDEVFCTTRRGSVEYTFMVPIPGLYRLDILAAQNIPDSVRDYFDIHFYIDGEFVGRQDQLITTDPRTFSFLSTYLRVGTHTITLSWDNVYKDTSLRIKSLQLSRPGGPDNNSNGRPDWEDSYLETSYSIQTYSSESKVSPAQIEGKGRYTTKILTTFADPIKRATHNRWFADVTLENDKPTDFAIEFEHGFHSLNGSITWVETNIFEETELSIKAGGSLMLNAVMDGDLESTTSIMVSDGNEINETFTGITADNALEYKFDQSGTYTITANYSGAQDLTHTMTVNVFAVPETDAPYIWRGKERFWNWDGLPEGVVLQADGMSFTQTVDGYLLKREEVFENINIVARLGENGPILKTLPTKAFWLRDVVEGYVDIVDILEDGSVVLNDTVFCVNFPEGMQMTISTISGVTFPDGSRTYNLTKDHFNELDEWQIVLIKSPDRTGAGCHWYKVYQNGIFVGQQNK